MFQHSEAAGTDGKYSGVILFQGKLILQLLFQILPQVQKIQIPHIIFQIVGGSLHNVGIEGVGSFPPDTEFGQKFCHLISGVAPVMDADVQERGQPQHQGAVFLIDGRQSGIFCPGGVGVHFHIGRPSFGITAVIQNTAQRFIAVFLKQNRLVKMAGIAFVGQSGIKLQGIIIAGRIDVNDIAVRIVDGGSQIKGRAQIILEGIVHILNLAGNLGSFRKIPGDHLLETAYDFCRFL